MIIRGEVIHSGFDARCSHCGASVAILDEAEVLHVLSGEFGNVYCFDCEGESNEQVPDILYYPGDYGWMVDGEAVCSPYFRIDKDNGHWIHLVG